MPLKVFPYLFLLGGFAVSLTCPAQDRGYTDGLYYGLRLLGESDGPFTLKRERPIASYAYRTGIGPQLLYVKNLNKRLGWGVETGGWLFWNTHTDTDDQGPPFHRRAVVLPLLANVHVSVIGTPRFGLYLQASGGLAYTQNVHRYDAFSRVEQRTSGIYGLTALVFIGLYKVKLSPGYYAGHRFGTSYFDLNGSAVHSVFVPVLLGDQKPDEAGRPSVSGPRSRTSEEPGDTALFSRPGTSLSVNLPGAAYRSAFRRAIFPPRYTGPTSTADDHPPPIRHLRAPNEKDL